MNHLVQIIKSKLQKREKSMQHKIIPDEYEQGIENQLHRYSSVTHTERTKIENIITKGNAKKSINLSCRIFSKK